MISRPYFSSKQIKGYNINQCILPSLNININKHHDNIVTIEEHSKESLMLDWFIQLKKQL